MKSRVWKDRDTNRRFKLSTLTSLTSGCLMCIRNPQARHFEKAVELFNQVLAQNPDHVQSHGNVALAYAGLGQKAAALKHRIRRSPWILLIAGDSKPKGHRGNAEAN